jgi:hypothetical protein
MKPFSPVLWNRIEGLLAMVADMNRMENAARLAMVDLGAELPASSVHSGTSFTVRLSLVLASLALTGLVAASLF